MSEQIDLSALIEKWPSAYVARSKVAVFTGGMIQPGTVANEDSRGQGPEGRIRINKQVAYPVNAFVRWLEKRAETKPSGCCRARKR